MPRGSEPPLPACARHPPAAPAPEKSHDGEKRAAGGLKPGMESYLPVQKGCDQAKVLGVLHEPAGVRGRGLVVWVPAPTLLAAGLPCPARPERRGQLPEGLRGLRKYFSAAQLPRKTGTLNLAQWSWAGRELQRADVHRGVGEGRGAESA